MLHALATIALCIFIGERLWHYVVNGDRYLLALVGKAILAFGGAAVGLAVVWMVLLINSHPH